LKIGDDSVFAAVDGDGAAMGQDPPFAEGAHDPSDVAGGKSSSEVSMINTPPSRTSG
jgi:hypothetical protein